MPVNLKRLSEITPAASKPALTDQLVAVIGGTTDALVKISDVGGRTKLTANIDYYVTTTGNDSTGDGSVGNSWRTIQHANNIIAQTLDLAAFTVVVHIAAGTYVGLSVSAYTGGGTVQYNGAGSGSTTINEETVSNSACLTMRDNNVTIVGINKVFLANLNSNLPCITNYAMDQLCIGDARNIDADDLKFDTGDFVLTTGGQWANTAFDFGINTGTMTLGGSMTSAGLFGILFAEFNAEIVLTCPSFVVSGTPHWGDSGVRCHTGGSVVNNAQNFSGAATGFRFNLQDAGNISDNLAGYYYIPGDVNGVASDTSTYGRGSYITHVYKFSGLGGSASFNTGSPREVVELDDNGAIAITIPAQNTTTPPIIAVWPDVVNPFSAMSEVMRIVQYGTGPVTITGGTGVKVNGVLGGTATMGGQFTAVTCYMRALDDWVVVPGL